MRSIRTIATDTVDRLLGAVSPRRRQAKAEAQKDETYQERVDAIRQSPINTAYGREFYELVREEFFKDTAEHEITVIREDGLYRHLRYQQPGTRMYSFDIVTWPGYLALTGDMGDFLFTRERDMFPWVAGQYVNYDYWAQKCVAGQTKEYSRKKFEGLVTEAVRDLLADLSEEYDHDLDETDGEGTAEAKPLEDLHQRKVLAIEDAARGLMFCGDTEFEAHDALSSHENRDSVLKFYDTWDWDLKDFSYRYLWLCVGMHHVINQYLKEAAA